MPSTLVVARYVMFLVRLVQDIPFRRNKIMKKALLEPNLGTLMQKHITKTNSARLFEVPPALARKMSGGGFPDSLKLADLMPQPPSVH